MAGSPSGLGVSAPARSRRPLLLGGIAVVLTALTIWDYSGLAERDVVRRDAGKGDPAALVRTESAGGRASQVRMDPFAEAARLRHYQTSSKLIRQRYNTIAVPYAEVVAGLAALHPRGQTPTAAAEYAVRSLIPEGVELQDIILAEEKSQTPEVVTVKATASLTSTNSQAFIKALLALGESANGMQWTSFSIAVDGGGHHISAKGDLNILTVEQAE